MKLLWIHAMACGIALGGCAIDLGQNARYGNFGGEPRVKEVPPAFSIADTVNGVRWFPNYVRFAPDDSHLLVSLCHIKRITLCRIGKYYIAENRWEILPYEERRTYFWPTYAPDGKSIVVTTAPCDEQYICPLVQYALARMPPDGSRLEKLIDTVAIHPSFSRDGKKLIYWKIGSINAVKGAALMFRDVAELDLTTGQERALTDFHLYDEHALGWPYFLPDGERFIFGAHLVGRIGWVYDPKTRQATHHRTDGTFLDRKLVGHPITMFAANLRDAPINKDNFEKLVPLWMDTMTAPSDVSRDGLISYGTGQIEKRKAGNPVALALPTNSNQEIYAGSNSNVGALFLRRPEPTAQDEAAFNLNGGGHSLSLSSDAKRLAFARAETIIHAAAAPHRRTQFGIIGLGERMPRFLDWPLLELKPESPH